MEPALKFREHSIRVLKANLATAEKDVVLFDGLLKSALRLGKDGFAYRKLLEHAYERVRMLKDSIASLRQRK
jgi:hypothetical protein